MLLNNDLGYFIVTAQNKTLLQAAENLGISQPALSRSITRLEDQLGFKVLQRSRSGIRLTEKGHELFLQASRTQAQMQQLVEGIRSGEKDYLGQLRMGAHSSLLEDFVLPVFPELLKEFPKMNFHFDSKPSFETLQDLVSEKLDIGLVINPAEYSTLILKNLATTQASFYSVIKEPKRFFINPQMVELARLLKLLRREGFDERNIYFISDYDIIARSIEQKLGCGLLPEHVARRFHLQSYGSFLSSYRTQFKLSLVMNSNVQNDRVRAVFRFLEGRIRG